jgi:hypothetical protein
MDTGYCLLVGIATPDFVAGVIIHHETLQITKTAPILSWMEGRYWYQKGLEI